MDDQDTGRESIPDLARRHAKQAKERAEKAVKSKWGRRFVRALFLTVLFFFGSAIVLSQTEWGEERMGRLAVEAIHDQLGLEATLDDIEVTWGWWPPSLTVEAEGIQLDHPEEGTLVTAESLVIRPSLAALVRGDVDLQTIELRSPTVRLRIRDGALVNLPELPESEPGGPIELPFEGLEITGGAIEVDASPLVEATVRGLDLSLSASGDELDFTLTTEGGEVRHETGVEAILELACNGGADLDQALVVDELQLSTPDLGLTLHNGELGFAGDELKYAGHVVGHFDTARLAELPLGVPLPAIEGRVAIEADVTTDEGEPHARGVLQLLGVVIEGRAIGESVALQLEATPERITILEGSEARLPLDGGTVALSGGLDLDAEAGFPVEVHVDFDFQFAKLIHMLGVTPDTPVWWPMTGDATLRGTLDPILIDGPVHVSTRDFLVTVGPHHARPRERVIGVRSGRVRGNWHIDAEAMQFQELTLDTPGSRVRVPIVHIGFDNSFRVEAHAERLDLADLSPLTEDITLAGVGTVDVTIGSDFDAPKVSGHADLQGFQFDFMRFGNVATDWRLRDDYYGVILPEVTATKPASSYRVQNLEVDLSDGVEVTGQLHASRLALQDVYHLFELDRDERFTPYQGVARGHMGIDFTYGKPGQTAEGTFVSDMDFELLSADLAGFAFDRGRFQGHLDWEDLGQGIDGAVLAIDHFGLRKAEGAVAIRGRIDRNTELQLTVAADQIGIDETEGIHESLPQLQGSYSVLGTIAGTADLPRMDLDMMITGLGWGESQLGDGRAYIRLTDPSDPWVAAAKDWTTMPEGEPCAHARHGLANANWRPGPPIQTQDGPVPRSSTPQAFLVCGEGIEGQVRVDMALGWTPVYPTRGVIDLVAVDLAPFLGSQGEAREVRGGVDGRIALTGGAMLQDRSLDGEIRLERFRLETDALGGSGTTLGVWNEEPIVVALRSGGAVIERLRLESNAESAFRARGRISPRGRLDLVLDGELHLGVLALLSADIGASSGTIQMHVDVGGPLGNPAVYGEARLRGGGLTTADGSRLRRLRGDVRFDARNILFTDFEGQLGGGRLSASGAANLENGALTRYTFELAMRNAVFVPEEGVEVGFDGDARIGWSQGQRLPRLTGNVQLGRVSYRRPIQLSPTLGQLYRPQVTQVERYDPRDDNLELDVRVETRTPVRVTNNLLDVTLAIEDQERPFKIVGTDQRWGVVGDIGIPQGTVRFRNTELSVADGSITFDDPTRLDPNFDVTATTEIRRQASAADLTAPAWRVRLRAHGTMDAFRIDASSTPSLSQEDLMLLLTVGMTSAEAQQLQAGDVGGTALEALSALSGVNEEVTSAVGIIDDFAVTTRYSPDTGRPEPMLTVGKRITERVRLSAATGLSGDDRTFQAGAEMRMGDQTSMQISYDNVNRESASNVGNIGVDFHWRLEFE